MEPHDILPFDGGGSCPVQYELEHDGHEFYVRYRRGWLTIASDDKEVFQQQLGETSDGMWSDKQTTVYLYLISEAIRNNTFSQLALPEKNQVSDHPMYVLGPLPRSHVFQCEEDHEHTLNCYSKELFSPVDVAARKNSR